MGKVAPSQRVRQGLDLFGEVPITWEDVFAWLEAVPGIPRDSPRAAWYIQGWNVVDKIRAAKLAGEFDAIVERPSTRPTWSAIAAVLDATRSRK